jgi:TadE-like protein
MVEFSMIVGVFLLLLLGAVSASVYTVQRSAAVTAVAAGARVAAGGSAGAAGAGTPNLAAATPAVAQVIAPLMVGTRVDQVPPPGDCREMRAIPRGEVDVCATRDGGMITVRLRGWPASAVPVPGLDWSLDLAAQAHAVTFAP